MNNNKTNIYYIYYQIVHEVHNRGIKLLTLAKSRSNESDIKPFRTKNNSSTALATATTRGSDLQKTPTNKTVVTRHKTKKNIRCAKAKFATAEQSTISNWSCHVVNRYAIASHKFNHFRVIIIQIINGTL